MTWRPRYEFVCQKCGEEITIVSNAPADVKRQHGSGCDGLLILLPEKVSKPKPPKRSGLGDT